MKYIAIVFMLNIALLYGGDLNPTDPIDMSPVQEVDILDMRDDNPSGRFDNAEYENTVYSGLSIGALKASDADGAAISLIAGLQLNDYLGVEARYTTFIADVDLDNEVKSIDVSNTSLFLKQTLPFIQTIMPYVLVGYGKNSYRGESDSSLAWGVGAYHSYNNNLNLFIDYVSYYNDNFDNLFEKDIEITSFSFGTLYKF